MNWTENSNGKLNNNLYLLKEIIMDQLFVKGLKCNSCVRNIENNLDKLDEILEVTLDKDTGQLNITTNENGITLNDVAKHLKEVGDYELVRSMTIPTKGGGCC